MSALLQSTVAADQDERSRAGEDICYPSPNSFRRPLRGASRGFLQNILVPTDFSPASEKTISFAAEFAAHCGARLTVLHVVDINSPQASAHAGNAESLMDRLWKEGVARMASLADELSRQKILAETILVEGLPWEQISNYSKGFDLTVLTRTPVRRRWGFFSRHTARRCIESLACPVLEV
jgi:nucleotide-binding universal stress UspA family protein